MATLFTAAALKSQGARRAIRLSLGTGEIRPQQTLDVLPAIDSAQKGRRAQLVEGARKAR